MPAFVLILHILIAFYHSNICYEFVNVARFLQIYEHKKHPGAKYWFETTYEER